MEETQQTPEMNTPEVKKEGAMLAALAYIPGLFIITAMQKKDEFHVYHAKAGFGMTLVFFLAIVVKALIHNTLGNILLVLWVLAVVFAAMSAFGHKTSSVPGLGWAQKFPVDKWFGGKKPMEAAIEATTTPAAEPMTEPMTEPVSEDPAEPEPYVIEPIVASNPEAPAAEPMAEPTMEAPVEPEAPAAEPMAEPTMEAPVEPEAPAAEPMAEPTMEAPVEPEAPAGEIKIEPATDQDQQNPTI